MRDKSKNLVAQWFDGKKAIGPLLRSVSAEPERRAAQSDIVVIPPPILKTLITIATNAWRAKTKMFDEHSGDVREDMKRVYRHVEAIYRNLQEIGVEIKDHTGEAYDDGQPMRVIASQPTPNLAKKRVLETLLPTVYFNGHILQNGEIVIATPEVASQQTIPRKVNL